MDRVSVNNKSERGQVIECMNKGVDEQNYNSHHCDNCKRKNSMASPNSTLKCEGIFIIKMV